MTKATASTYRDAPPPKVWAFINDLRRKPEYVRFVREVFDISGHPIREGTVYRERARFGPRESVSEWRLVQFDPRKRQVQRSESWEMTATFTADLKPEGDGTRMTVEMDVRLLPLLRSFGWILERLIIRRKMQRDVELTLKTLKQLVEAEREP